MTPPNAPRPNDDDARQARARRTALWLGVFVVLVFAGFIAFSAVTR